MDRLLSMRVFQKVIDEGGFAAAARALDLSPAVVTRQSPTSKSSRTRLPPQMTVGLAEPGRGNYLNRVRILQDIDKHTVLPAPRPTKPVGVLRILTPPRILPAGPAARRVPWRAAPEDPAACRGRFARGSADEDYGVTLLPTNDAFDADTSRARSATKTSSSARGLHQDAEDPTTWPPNELLRLRGPGMAQRIWRLQRGK